MTRHTAALSALALCAAAGAAHATTGPVTLLTSEVFDVPSGPLVLAPSLNEVVAYSGSNRIDNDGNWYGTFIFPVSAPNNALEFGRDIAMFRNGTPYNREGYALPGSSDWALAADFGGSQSPYSDTQLASDGTVAQVARGVTGFGIRPDGSADTTTGLTAFPGLDRFDLAIIDNQVIFTEGDAIAPFDTQFQLPAGPLAVLGAISTIEPISATDILVAAEFVQGPGTFDPSVNIVFGFNPSTAASTGLLLSDESTYTIPGLGLGVSTFNRSEEGFDANDNGSFINTIDIRGAGFAEDDAVLLYDGTTGAYSIVARAGDPSPLGAGRTLSLLFNNAVAINQAGDIAYVIDDTGGSSADDTAIIARDGTTGVEQIIARENDTVGTLQPGALQSLRLFGGANLEIDREGNVIYPGVWSIDNLCTGQTSNGSDFGIFQAIFFNDQPILESGVTEIHDVTIGSQFFDTLVVKEIINTEFGGFSVSPDGDRLIAAVFAVEPSMNICDFSSNNDSVPGQFLLVEVDLEQIRNPVQACPGDADGDNVVGTSDLLILLANWGQQTANGSDEGDFDDSGTVGTADLLVLLANWGNVCN